MLNFILNLFRRQKINLAHYPKPKTDYGALNAAQRNAMDNILAACVESKDTADIPEMTQAEFDAVVTHIGMHFGCERPSCNIALKRFDSLTKRHYAIVKPAIYAEVKAHQAELDALIDTALATLCEGTTEYKLKQVCWWIANHARYKPGTNNPLDLLDEGAMCGAYSMLFYKMATRLGVKAYICHGQLPGWQGGGPHAWNMVELDGKSYFYDVTWYDTSGRLPWFLHSKTNWGREYKLDER